MLLYLILNKRPNSDSELMMWQWLARRCGGGGGMGEGVRGVQCGMEKGRNKTVLRVL